MSITILFTTIFKYIILVIYLLLSYAFFTLAERKIMAALQRRKGPNVIGVFGVLQPLADGLKLFVNEGITPSNANKTIFISAPFFAFFISQISWVIYPFYPSLTLVDINYGVLYVMCASSISVYGVILAGWASNSKYAFLGALRSTAQMISYELTIGMILCTIASASGSFNLIDIVEDQASGVWYIFPFFPLFGVYLICMVAETNRHPFDLPEAEAELVSGYNTEYSGMMFALFSLGEYAHIYFASSLAVALFLGGSSSPIGGDCLLVNSFFYAVKLNLFIILFIVLRAALPRFRFDQLMDLGWTVFLPFSIVNLFFYYTIIWVTNSSPL